MTGIFVRNELFRSPVKPCLQATAAVAKCNQRALSTFGWPVAIVMEKQTKQNRKPHPIARGGRQGSYPGSKLQVNQLLSKCMSDSERAYVQISVVVIVVVNCNCPVMDYLL